MKPKFCPGCRRPVTKDVLRGINMLTSGNIRTTQPMRVQCPFGCKGKNSVVLLTQADLDALALRKPELVEA